MKINSKNVQKATQLNQSVNTIPNPEANSQSIQSESQKSQSVSQFLMQRAPLGLIPIASDSPSIKLFATPVGLFELSRFPYSTHPSNPI